MFLARTVRALVSSHASPQRHSCNSTAHDEARDRRPQSLADPDTGRVALPAGDSSMWPPLLGRYWSSPQCPRFRTEDRGPSPMSGVLIFPAADNPARPLARRTQWLTRLAPAACGLGHDDRVVDEQADAEREPTQRQDVDRDVQRFAGSSATRGSAAARSVRQRSELRTSRISTRITSRASKPPTTISCARLVNASVTNPVCAATTATACRGTRRAVVRVLGRCPSSRRPCWEPTAPLPLLSRSQRSRSCSGHDPGQTPVCIAPPATAAGYHPQMQ